MTTMTTTKTHDRQGDRLNRSTKSWPSHQSRRRTRTRGVVGGRARRGAVRFVSCGVVARGRGSLAFNRGSIAAPRHASLIRGRHVRGEDGRWRARTRQNDADDSARRRRRATTSTGDGDDDDGQRCRRRRRRRRTRSPVRLEALERPHGVARGLVEPRGRVGRRVAVAVVVLLQDTKPTDTKPTDGEPPHSSAAAHATVTRSGYFRSVRSNREEYCFPSSRAAPSFPHGIVGSTWKTMQSLLERQPCSSSNVRGIDGYVVP